MKEMKKTDNFRTLYDNPTCIFFYCKYQVILDICFVTLNRHLHTLVLQII
jgi:hypothetical protein